MAFFSKAHWSRESHNACQEALKIARYLSSFFNQLIPVIFSNTGKEQTSWEAPFLNRLGNSMPLRLAISSALWKLAFLASVWAARCTPGHQHQSISSTGEFIPQPQIQIPSYWAAARKKHVLCPSSRPQKTLQRSPLGAQGCVGAMGGDGAVG